MKKTRRFAAAVMALAMAAAAAPMSAFASDVTEVKPDPDNMPNPKPASASFEVKYDVDPSYTVTIPAGVDITLGEKTGSITLLENPLLPEGSKIKVVLQKGEYTTSGNAFTAKTESGNSSAGYQIKKGNDTVAVGDTVASLDKATLSSSLTFSRTQTPAPTYAGKHAEVLTFGISVESAPEEKTTVIFGVTIKYSDGDTWAQVAEKNDSVAIAGKYVRVSGKILQYGNDDVKPTDIIDPNKNYIFDA